MAPLTDYRLRLATLGEGMHARHFSCGMDFFNAMECDELTGAELDVDVSIDAHNGSFAMEFRIRGSVSTSCDRCLEPVEIHVDEVYDLTVRYGAAYDDTTDGVIVIPADEATFDLAPVIRDTVVLALPLRRVHPEGECEREAARTLGEHTAPDGATDPAEE